MKTLISLALACALACSAFAVDVGISPTPKLQFSDVNGVPLAGGLIDTFICATTTPTATYTDSTGSVANSNPVVLDSGGFASIWLPGCVKFRVKNSASVVQYTIDNVNLLPPWAVVTNPSGTQTISGAALQLNNNFTLIQSTAATGAANQSGYSLCGNGSYWNGAASATDQWCWQNVLGAGANPSSTFTLSHSGSSGTAHARIPELEVTNLYVGTVITDTDGSGFAINPAVSSGLGGFLTIKAGQAGGASAGGNLLVQGGTSDGVNTGGVAQLIGGTGGTAAAGGNGGQTDVRGGDASGGTGANGGNVVLRGGNRTGASTYGVVQVQDRADLTKIAQITPSSLPTATTGTVGIALTNTASLDYDLSAAGITCQDLTITVTGAADGDAVSVGVPNALASTAGVNFDAWVSAANTVSVRMCDETSGNPNPAAATVRATVWKF